MITKSSFTEMSIWINGFRLPADRSTNLVHGDNVIFGSVRHMCKFLDDSNSPSGGADMFNIHDALIQVFHTMRN